MIALNFGFGALEAEFWRLMFAMTRIGAAMLAAPFFGAGSVPPQVRVIAAGALAVLVCAWTPLTVPAAIFSLAGAVAVLGEVLVGLALGFVLQMLFAAPTIAAEVIGGTMGMSLASTVDPHTGSHSPALGQYFSVMLSLTFLAVGGHLVWFSLLIESYRVFPTGAAWLGVDRIAAVAGYASLLFVSAIAVALPVTLILLLMQVLTAIVSRSAPALNLFALGLPAGVLAGLAALIVSAPLASEQMIELSHQAIAVTRSLLE